MTADVFRKRLNKFPTPAPQPVTVGSFVIVTGQEVELGEEFEGVGGIVCDAAFFQDTDPKNKLYGDTCLFVVYVYADSDVYILPETALTVTTREEALCAVTG